jgi:transcriptional regulator with XRE-family HTH domain
MRPVELRNQRKALHMTQTELGRALGVARNTVARWERGVLTARQPDLVALALEQLQTDRCLTAAAPGRRSQTNNIPIELTSFVGREHELGELRDLLRTTRLLTLTGVGGVGKTRLAQRLAQAVLAD